MFWILESRTKSKKKSSKICRTSEKKKILQIGRIIPLAWNFFRIAGKFVVFYFKSALTNGRMKDPQCLTFLPKIGKKLQRKDFDFFFGNCFERTIREKFLLTTGRYRRISMTCKLWDGGFWERNLGFRYFWTQNFDRNKKIP